MYMLRTAQYDVVIDFMINNKLFQNIVLVIERSRYHQFQLNIGFINQVKGEYGHFLQSDLIIESAQILNYFISLWAR